MVMRRRVRIVYGLGRIDDQLADELLRHEQLQRVVYGRLGSLRVPHVDALQDLLGREVLALLEEHARDLGALTGGRDAVRAQQLHGGVGTGLRLRFHGEPSYSRAWTESNRTTRDAGPGRR